MSLPRTLDRVYLGIHAPTKAAILAELQRRGLADDDAERVYAELLVIDSVLEGLGLAVVRG